MLYELYERLRASPMFKRRLLQASVGVAVLLVLLWFYNHAFVSISIDSPAQTALGYNLLDQHSQRSQQFSSSAHTVKRLVRRGSHEIMVRQGETSFFAIAHTGGFLATTQVRGSLKPENSRQFVGNNPAGCTQYINQVLLSYDCSSATLGSLVWHVLATASQPTYTSNNADALGPDAGNLMEGVVGTPQGTFVLSQLAAARSVGAGTHVLQPVNQDLSFGQGRTLSELDPNKTYAMYGYRGGFLVADTSFNQLLYYPSATAPASVLHLGAAVGKDFAVFSSSVQDNVIVVGYTSANDDTNRAGKQRFKSKFIVSQNGQAKQFVFSKQYSSASLCGPDRLCLLGNKRLEVYNISGRKPKLLFTVGDALAVQPAANSLLIARDKEILRVDVANQQGFAGYSFSSYAYCGGLRVDGAQYTICATNGKQKKVALQLSLNTTNIDSVDKKIAQLLKYYEVDDISAYGPFIYLVPNYGPSIYDSASQGYIPDPAEVKRVNAALDQAINKVGIDRNSYHIINAFSGQ